MINRMIDLEVKDNVSKLKEKIYIYKNDYNVCFMIKPIIKYAMTAVTPVADFTGGVAEVVFLKPDGSESIVKIMEMDSIYVHVLIDKDMSDDLNELGLWKVQIRLRNAENTSRLTLPPFDFEILPLIADV